MEPPRLSGLQTGVVTGPSGEDVFTDDYGRVKVHFHWDRSHERNEHSSCWLRVMHSMAGPNFGTCFTPRIGQEVVIAFENGNPERPFVIGALYHTEHLPPYATQRGKRMHIRRQTIKSNNPSHANELYFEDTPGQEEVYLQAEKGLNILFKSDESKTVQENQKNNVGQNALETVGQNKKVTAQESITFTAGASLTLQVGGSKIEMTGSGITITGNNIVVKCSSVSIN